MARVKHIQVNTLPAQLEPGAIYFVRSTGKIVQTDMNGVPVEFGGEVPLKARVVPAKQIHIKYSPMSYTYDYADFTELNPSVYWSKTGALWTNFGSTYSRIAVYYHEPAILDYILFKNIGQYHGVALNIDAREGLKSGIIWGIRDPKDIPVGGGRNVPIPSGIKLYEGDFDRITDENWWEMQKIPVNVDEPLYGIVLDGTGLFEDHPYNRFGIQKLISIKK